MNISEFNCLTKATNGLMSICFCFLMGGCYSEANLTKDCVPKLAYKLDKNYMHYSNLGSLEKPEIIEIVRRHDWPNSFTFVESNRSGIVMRNPIKEKHGVELVLLGPAIDYINLGPVPDRTLLYVSIDGNKTWIMVEDLIGVALDQPFDINRQNNIQLNVQMFENWQCPKVTQK